MFRRMIQHGGKNTTEARLANKAPYVAIQPLAQNKMNAYVEIAKGEVGWLGQVKQDGLCFIIEDVYLLDQEVGGQGYQNLVEETTEITTEGLNKFGSELLARSDGVEIWNQLCFWGHSHGNLIVSPSKQDNDQMMIFYDCGHSFFIRGIFNKSGEARFDIYYIVKDGDGMVFVVEDVPWGIYREVSDDSLLAKIREEFASKVREKIYVPPSAPTYPYYLNPKRTIGGFSPRVTVKGENSGYKNKK